ncbi:Caleosin-domain-containing protein [Plenodomus tracheiphilus IPT5]|uniref:Caleosin-domain-containing protein n=1 Tax=Plenodomus tracheiphilus IPT5 TaxID=1408161 RepID=A0A6A7BJF1_9PLEO|nr:Caleosin-domain-containing protein [Plenodomus tracheiphilus IPT5]
MPSRVEHSNTFVPSPDTRQPAEVTKSSDEDELLLRERSFQKPSAMLKQTTHGNKDRGHDWIAGVEDICYHAPNKGQTLSHDNFSRMQQCDCKFNPVSPASSLGQMPMKVIDPSKGPFQQKSSNTKRSALQRHCDFWDADKDGLIYPWDIFVGFRKLGFNIALCLWAAVTMCMCSSYSTQTSWLPHPMLAINLDKIDCCRHGSTTGAYDLEAELDSNRFDAVFRKYAEGKDYLTWRTMYNVWRGQCCANDFFGWFAGGLEWIAMYILLWPHDGRLRKEDIRGVYDGSIFFKIAEARA